MNDLNRMAWIDMDAMGHNLSVVRKQCPNSKVIAYIKAGGYGHGIANSAAFWYADAFSISSMAEARIVRRYTKEHPVLLNGAIIDQSMINFALEFDIDLIIHDVNPAALEYCHSRRRVWLKVNTGMNRMGITLDQVESIIAQMNPSQSIVLMTHLADSVRYSAENEIQIQKCLAVAKKYNLEVSFANSARILSGKTVGDWVRPGLMLYGVSPYMGELAQSLSLHPAMTVKARVIAHQTLQCGDTVGYDRSYVAKKEERIAIVSFGYADGYPRSSIQTQFAYFNNQMFPIVGKVSMDTLQICSINDELPDVGEWVTLWGRNNPIEKVALASGRIPYEMLVHLNDRVERKIQVPIYE